MSVMIIGLPNIQISSGGASTIELIELADLINSYNTGAKLATSQELAEWQRQINRWSARIFQGALLIGV